MIQSANFSPVITRPLQNEYALVYSKTKCDRYWGIDLCGISGALSRLFRHITQRTRSQRGVSLVGVSFIEAHELHVDAIYRFILRLLGNPTDAEDMTAETFLRAYQGWPELLDPAAVRFIRAGRGWNSGRTRRHRSTNRPLNPLRQRATSSGCSRTLIRHQRSMNPPCPRCFMVHIFKVFTETCAITRLSDSCRNLKIEKALLN
ncbi:MAG: hypothetical protein OXI86_20635 [Candidatus Poribacteria bacterium]|nr:hypothetical protein [Candidatus Poribacteria bacterium]